MISSVKYKQIGDHALPQRGFDLGTPKGAEGGGATPGNTRPGRNERGLKQLCTKPAANTRSPVGTAASAKEAPTKKIKHARTEQAAAETERGKADKKQKGSRSHGMQNRRTSAGLKESTCSAWRTRVAVTVSPDKRFKRSSHKSVDPGNRREALQLQRRCWPQRQRRSTTVYPPAVCGGARVMQTWQLERGQSPCSGMEFQGTE
jgi:hypothetical protein